MATGLDYLDDALHEAEAAARWYAERSTSAALGFSEEIDAAEQAIADFPDAWRFLSTARAGTFTALSIQHCVSR